MRWTPSFSLLLLSALLLAIAIAGAENSNNGRKRQVVSVDESQTDSPSPTDSPTTTTTSSTSSSTPEPPTTSQPENPTTPSTNEPPPKTTSPETPTKTTNRTTPPPRTNSPQPTQSSVVIITNTITISGSTFEQTSASTITPGQSPAPGLSNDNDGGRASSGLSDSSKRIIIGVVVGVGGAILVGGLAFVAWRLRRKRNSRGVGDDDDLMNAGTAVGSSSHETSTVGMGPSPFTSTLDQYHHPGGVNPSSNF
ncbi:cell wall protein [Histoplasma ohiense]|nr:cell wall protein [Histoplasma ohiense (nom. inval.)]